VDAALANGEPYATLDGDDLSFSRITRTFHPLILPEPNVFGLPGGEYGHPDCADPTRCLTASDGLWVYLPEGLEKGKHTVKSGTNNPKPEGGDFRMKITYKLMVV
jgi:hypothetical protein